MGYVGKKPAPVALTSSDITNDIITEAKIADNAVENEHLNANVITGHTALGATPADTDELLVSDAGTLKRVDFSYLKGGGMFEFISSTDVTSGVAQVDFTSFSTDYSDFKIVIQNVHTTTDNQEFKLRFFNNAGSIIDSSIYQWSFDGADTGAFQNDSNGNGTDHAVLGKAVGSATYESASLEVTIYDVHETVDWKHFMYTQTFATTGAEYGYAFGGGFSKYHNSDNYSVSGVRFFWNSGNIASGRFSLYGRKHS